MTWMLRSRGSSRCRGDEYGEMSNEEMGQATNLRSVQTPRTARSELSREQAQRLGGVVRNGDVLKSDARRECTSNARIATLIAF